MEYNVCLLIKYANIKKNKKNKQTKICKTVFVAAIVIVTVLGRLSEKA